MINETPTEFLKRLRKKAKKHGDKLSHVEEIFLKVVDNSDKEAILGEGSGTKL